MLVVMVVELNDMVVVFVGAADGEVDGEVEVIAFDVVSEVVIKVVLPASGHSFPSPSSPQNGYLLHHHPSSVSSFGVSDDGLCLLSLFDLLRLQLVSLRLYGHLVVLF